MSLAESGEADGHGHAREDDPRAAHAVALEEALPEPVLPLAVELEGAVKRVVDRKPQREGQATQQRR